MSKKVTVEQMLEAGLHFGHQTFRWHPNMKPYIFDSRDNIHIIDLTKTEEKLKDALNFVEQLAESGGMLMLVGTKRQASATIAEMGKSANLPYIANRWPGGLLTNFSTMKTRIRHLKQLREKFAKKDFGDLTKQEIGLLEKKMAILEDAFGGLDMLTEIPNALFIVDILREKIAVKEALRLDIPVVAMVDTNTNPEDIAFPIPANDDAKQGIRLITKALVDAYVAHRAQLATSVKTDTQEGEEAVIVEETELEEVLRQKEAALAMSKQEEEEMKQAEEKTKKTSGNN
ncbi:TPA: 30S ribosomal protein S2 [Patescibacteria group bacterium]|nr:30S ribosomal protein S2 [Patescibacteria group bacterium]